MNPESPIRNIKDLLIDSSFAIPIAYAVWKSEGDEVFISNKLRFMISSDSNFVDPYKFVKLMKRSFGSFLNIAVEKVSDNNHDRCEYSSTVNILKEDFSLRLIFERNKQFYIFIAENSKKDNSKKSDSELEKILDTLPVYVWQKDKNFKITYCNKPYSNAVESTPNSVVTNNIKLIAPSRKDSVYVNQNLYFSKPRKTEEHVVINGSRRCLQIIETPFVGNDFSTGIAIDITDKEELQKEYDSYKKQTEETLDNVSVPIAIFNQETVLIFANSAMMKLFPLDGIDIYENCKFADLIDHFISNGSIVVVSDVAEYKEKVTRLFSTVIEPHHAFINLKNGKTMNVTISPNRNTGGLMFIFEDISEKLNLEREITSTSAIQIEIIDNLSEGIIIFGSDNKIKIMNLAIDNIWGENRSKDIGKHIQDFFEAVLMLFNSPDEVEDWISKLINLSVQRIKFVDSLSLTSGKTVKYSYTPLPEGLNLITFLDVTDSINLEKAMTEKNEIVSQFDKTKANLISNISYEFKSPLNTISGFAEILCNQYFGSLNDKQLEYCHGIGRMAERAIEIVETIINLANIEVGFMRLKYEEVSLLAFINESIELFLDRANAQGINLKTDFTDPEIKVFFDTNAMKQVLFQLISRSIRITPNGGEIVISIAFSKLNDRYFDLIIRDTGTSFLEDDLEKSQKALQDDTDSEIADRSVELGIILANRIVKLHHGKMLIDSKNGEGSTIKCIIPVKQFLL